MFRESIYCQVLCPSNWSEPVEADVGAGDGGGVTDSATLARLRAMLDIQYALTYYWCCDPYEYFCDKLS